LIAADWLERHARSVLLAAALLAAAGIFAALRLPVTLFPQTDFPRIAVALEAGDRSAERMLTEVTIPVEDAVRSVPGVRSMRSRTSRGSAEISVTFDWGHNMAQALLEVQNAVSGRSSALPPGCEIRSRRLDPTVFPVLGYSVTSESHSLVDLRDLAIHRVRPVLSSVEGVARTDVAGGGQEEIHVEVDAAALAAHGLTAQDVAAALADANVVQAAGRMEDHSKLYLVMIESPLMGAKDVENIPVRAGAGGMIRLGDVATVSIGQSPEWVRVTADGHDAVLIQVYQQPDANTVQLSHAAAAKVAELIKSLPADVHIANWYDQSQLVESSAAGLRDAVIIGAVLAALVLLLFLRNLRITLIAAITVPGVLASACLLLMVLHQTLNVMTLGGMAAAVGLIIDDAIVMIEHVVARVRGVGAAAIWSRGHVLGAAAEFTRPLMGASLATIIIHIPPAFLSGVTGEFFKALSLTIGVSLVVSFVLAWTVVPLLSSWLLSARDAAAPDFGRIFRGFSKGYGGLLSVSLRWPWLVALPVAALIAVGLLAYPRLKSGFMPVIDEGGFVLDYRTPPGTSLAETDRVLRQVEDIIRRTPEVDTYSRRTGLQLGGGLTEANEGDFFIRLKPRPRRDIEEVMDDVRTRVQEDVPGLNVEMAQLMEDLISDLTAVPQPVEVKLYSEDERVLVQVGMRVADTLSKLPGLEDINDPRSLAGDALEVHVDAIKAAAEGLDPATVAATLQQVLSGSIATQYQVFGDTPKVIGIRVWSPRRERRIEEDLARVQLKAPDGHVVPVARVAWVEHVTGQPQIQREDLRRMTSVTARTNGIDLGTAIASVKQALADPALLRPTGEIKDLAPPAYALGGLYQEQQTAFIGLISVFGAAIVLLLVLLTYWYESLRVAVCLVLTSLLALPGVAAALWLTGTELNISSMMGLAMIAGSVTEVGVFLCSELLFPIEPLLTAGSAREQVREAISAAAQRRLRPITMTTLAATLAMVPLVVGLGEGTAMLRPLALAIIAGLIVQLPLVLLVLPALLVMTGAVAKHRRPASPGHRVWSKAEPPGL
jgi:multidrug efflux pump subunit AcrB